ncbi:MAG: helix-turn-helix domain-containing protein [Haloarculaceae archaeon]
MTPGIRAELVVPDAVECPLARTAAETDARTRSVTKSVDPNRHDRVVEEFAMRTEDGAGPDLDSFDVTKVFERGSEAVYRFERSEGTECPCECVETYGLPVVDVQGESGRLHLVFHTPDREALRDVIASIREFHPSVEVRRLVQSKTGEETESLVFFDRSTLTERQEEVLRLAHREGYFEHPKGANAGEVAETLDITTATFIQHLSAAQQKLLDSVLAAESDA